MDIENNESTKLDTIKKLLTYLVPLLHLLVNCPTLRNFTLETFNVVMKIVC